MENFLNKLINPTVRTYGFKKKSSPPQKPYAFGLNNNPICSEKKDTISTKEERRC